jgi:hypothetical protein
LEFVVEREGRGKRDDDVANERFIGFGCNVG